jgi:K+-sensing histidine kinase KdpD
MPAGRGERVLVPVFGGDIGSATMMRARAALAEPGASLVILHVSPAHHDAHPARARTGVPTRWRELARSAPTFVGVVSGDAVESILAEAGRFHSDRVLLERPSASAPDRAWLGDVIDRVRRAAPDRVTVLPHHSPVATRRPAVRGPSRARPSREEAPCAAR